MYAAVVIPVKSFRLAKGRLAGALAADERESLARECASTVVAASRPFPAYVVCDDDEVASWAEVSGAVVVRCDTPGLDVAVAAGVRAAVADGADHLVVAHADLPLATTFAHLVVDGTVVLVPDRHRDGTNVLAFPATPGFTTAYGPGSYANHLRIAELAGLASATVDDPDLSLDLDDAADLDELRRRHGRNTTP